MTPRTLSRLFLAAHEASARGDHTLATRLRSDAVAMLTH